MIRLITLILVCLSATACVSTQNVTLDTELNKSFANKTLAVTKRGVPAFAATTSTDVLTSALFGAIGGLNTISLGNKIITSNNVDDPAIYIGDVLSKDFSAEFNATFIDRNDVVLTSENVKKIIEQYDGIDYLMDVRTINWSFVYFPTTWGKYRVIYSAKLRLIGVQQGTVAAEGFCSRVPEKTSDAPSYEEMLANEAFIIKRELNIAANKCINEFKKNVLNLPETPLESIAIPEVSKVIAVSEIQNQIGSTESEYPEIVAGLNSSVSTDFQRAASKVSQKRLYTDSGVLNVMIARIEQVVENPELVTDRYQIDAFAHCVLNVGKSDDSRSEPLLNKVVESGLHKKIKSHAASALRRKARLNK